MLWQQSWGPDVPQSPTCLISGPLQKSWLPPARDLGPDLSIMSACWWAQTPGDLAKACGAPKKSLNSMQVALMSFLLAYIGEL